MSGNPIEGGSSLDNAGNSVVKSDGSGTTRLRYRPIIALGHGGMADVLLSVGRGPGGFHKLVVLKTMRKELATDQDLREMFLAEAKLSARLNHANVVQVYEVVDTALPCIVMEYLEGQSMSALQRAAGANFTLPMQLRVISETLSGLHYSHELQDYDGTPLNIVHRDVSPQNVFITYDGVVKVLDFGIAKASDANNQTRTGVIKGKVTYMPREQLLNENVDRRADIYAVGCMLWHAAAGTKLWSDMPEGEVMRALIEGNTPKPSSRREVAPELEAIVMKALSPDPNDRYSTALELRDEIDAFLAKTDPNVSVRQVGDLLTKTFAEQFESRKKQIHLALTAPHSEVPPPIPEGLESIIRSATGTNARDAATAPSRKAVWMLAAALGATVLAMAAMFLFFVWKGSRPQAEHSTAAATAATVQIRLTALPAGATLTVDGRVLPGNPASLSVGADSQDHEVRASLDGYEPYIRTVRFERDLSLDIMLQVRKPPSSAAVDENAQKPAAPVAPAVAGKSSGRAPVVAPKKKGAADCNPPFYFENGIKTYKPECL